MARQLMAPSSETIFISYSTSDQKIADALYAALTSRGVKCWMAPQDIGPGEIYADAIVSAIKQCTAIAIVFTDAANRSKFVLNEVSVAASEELKIIPVRHSKIEYSNALRFYLGACHWIDASDPNYIDQIVSLANLSAQLLPEPRPELRPTRMTRALFGWLVLAAVVAAGLAAFQMFNQTPKVTQLRIASITYDGNGEFPNQFLNQLTERLHREDPSFQAKPINLMYSQSQVEEIFRKIEAGEVDVVRFTPYVYFLLEQWLQTQASPNPLEQIACFSKKKQDEDFASSHHSILFSAANQIPPEAALNVGALSSYLLEQQKNSRTVEFILGNRFSMSSYVAPCLAWASLIEKSGHSRLHAGGNNEIKRIVLQEKTDALRIGAMSEHTLRALLDSPPQLQSKPDVLWLSDRLPQGGIAVVNNIGNERHAFIVKHIRALVSERSQLSTGQPVSNDSNDFDQIGPCNDDLYRILKEKILRSPEGALCELNRPRPK